MREHAITVESCDELKKQGKTPLYFASETVYLGAIVAADVLKDDSTQAVKAMEALGLEVVMLTGDNEKTAHAIAEQAGIRHVVSDVLPGDKAGVIEKLRQEGRRVLMCHGHLYQVGMGLSHIKQKARDMGANIVLFGHTHVPVNMEENGILFLNPGSLTKPRGGSACSYALLEIENGKAAANIISFN